MVAKATNEGRMSPVPPVPLAWSPSKDVYEPWQMSEREKDLTQKCVRLIQGKPTKELPESKQGEASPMDETSDMSCSMMSMASSVSQE
jgi:kinesin family member 1